MTKFNKEQNKWLLEPHYNHWIDLFGKYLDSENLENFRTKAYYASKLMPGLRLITLNSHLHNKNNFFVKHLPVGADPLGQIAFLEKTLATAEKAGEKVIISSHIPPEVESITEGLAFWIPYLDKFNELVSKYSATIVGQFYGHTHYNSFVVERNLTSLNPTSVSFITASLTTYVNTNPGFLFV